MKRGPQPGPPVPHQYEQLLLGVSSIGCSPAGPAAGRAPSRGRSTCDAVPRAIDIGAGRPQHAQRWSSGWQPSGLNHAPSDGTHAVACARSSQSPLQGGSTCACCVPGQGQYDRVSVGVRACAQQRRGSCRNVKAPSADRVASWVLKIACVLNRRQNFRRLHRVHTNFVVTHCATYPCHFVMISSVIKADSASTGHKVGSVIV